MINPLSANALQARFDELGLPEPIMIQLQITEHDLGWDLKSAIIRERFLARNHVLVVDRRNSPPKISLVNPTHLNKFGLKNATTRSGQETFSKTFPAKPMHSN